MMEAYQELTSLYSYDINIINQKITEEVPTDINYSDDELGFLSYLPYFFSERPELSTEVRLGIKRAWEFIKTGD
jgi:hypothetical protein